MKTVDHSYEQALIMHDNVHIHVIMNIIVTPKESLRDRGVEALKKHFYLISAVPHIFSSKFLQSLIFPEKLLPEM